MIEIVVYLNVDCSKNESIWVDSDLTKDEITDIVNDRFDKWYFYDILD